MKRDDASKVRRGPRGASLVEVMVSMVVLAIGVLGAMHANVLATNQSGLASREMGAAAIGRDMIDSFERLPYTHPALAVGSYTYSSDQGSGNRPLLGATAAIMMADGHVSGTGTSLVSRYSVSWTVSQYIPEARMVSISVSFTTPAGGQKTLSFNTIKFDPTSIVGPSAPRMEEGI